MRGEQSILQASGSDDELVVFGMALVESLRRLIQEHRLIQPGTTLLVGVSGGVDSLVLLHMLCALRDRQGFSLHAATLDHGLRGQEGARDVAAVQSIAESWHVPVTTGQVDTITYAKEQHLSAEAAARDLRYRFLAQTAHQVGALRVAVAHHADDQAETVLMRLLRGASAEGLAGMQLSRFLPADPPLTLIRPLLFHTRAEIQAYADEHGLVPCIDSTNTDTGYLRNRLRVNLLPQLESINPAIRQTLSRMAEVAALEDEFMHSQLLDALPRLDMIERPERISARRAAFHDLHPALHRRWIRWAALRINPASELDYHHIRQAVEIALHGRQGSVAQLGGGLSLRVDYGWLHVESEQAQPTPSEFQSVPLVRPGFNAVLALPGSLALTDSWTLRAELDRPAEKDFTGFRLAIPPAASITVRTRHPGDMFRPKGLRGRSRKFSDWLIDSKIPRALRDQIPLICVHDEIAAFYLDEEWIVAYPFTEYAESDHRSFWLSYVRNPPI